MSVGYQRQDRKVIDYNLWFLPDLREALRGPVSYAGGRYVTFLGAAQTFGRFVPRPFPELVSNYLGCEHINFGFAGAGPGAFAQDARIMHYVNASEICFLQVMSGRSVSTPLLRRVAKGGVVQFLSGPARGRKMLAQAAYEIVLEQYGAEVMAEQVAAARLQWIDDYTELLDRIEVPVVLVWVSARRPDYKAALTSVKGVFGGFPQLVDLACLDAVRHRAALQVDATYPGPRAHHLFNKITGAPEPVYDAARFPDYPFARRFVNGYYPSPEMHDFTATAIVAALARAGIGNLDQARTVFPMARATRPSP